MSHATGTEILARNEVRLPQIRGRHLENTTGSLRVANLLSPGQQAQIAAIATKVEFGPKSEIIFNEGEDAPFAYLVARGLVRLSRSSTSGRRQVIAFLMPGDVFGYPQNGVYANAAKAMGEVVLYQLPWPRLYSLMHKEPQLQANFLARLTFDLQEAQKRIMVLGQQNVSQRLASFLLELMDHEDFFDSQKCQLTLPISRFDLADYLGTSPETTVRALARLEKDGLIQRLSTRVLLVPHAVGLMRLLGGRRRID